MAKLSAARRAALAALMHARESGRYVRDSLARDSATMSLDARDAAFARLLALGVTATQGCLDDALNAQLDKEGSVSVRVRMALRIATYEMLYLDTAPEVAVSQGVELVRSCAKRAAGLANAVLRRVGANREAFLDARDADGGQRPLVSAARHSGLPVWLARRIAAAHPDDVDAILISNRGPARTYIHLNPRLDAAGLSRVCDLHISPTCLPGCHAIDGVGALARAGAFARGDVVASDLHAQLIATAATAPGSCLEVGAGRGVKTYVIQSQSARAGLARDHVAIDLHEGKCAANASRLASADFPQVEMVAGDARELSAILGELDAQIGRARLFDTVLLDAPCSGTGTMRRHGEIPWRLTPCDIDRDLPSLQLNLLCAAAMRVAVGGQLLYATCSILPAENIDVIEGFLATREGSDFELARVSDAWFFSNQGLADAASLMRGHEDARGFFQTLPLPGGADGHFCARFRRRV